MRTVEEYEPVTDETIGRLLAELDSIPDGDPRRAVAASQRAYWTRRLAERSVSNE